MLKHLNTICLLALIVVVLAPELAQAGGMAEFVGPMEKLIDVLTGKVAYVIVVIGIICVGIMLIFKNEEMSESMKALTKVVFAACIIVGAVALANHFFSFSGAVI